MGRGIENIIRHDYCRYGSCWVIVDMKVFLSFSKIDGSFFMLITTTGFGIGACLRITQTLGSFCHDHFILVVWILFALWELKNRYKLKPCWSPNGKAPKSQTVNIKVSKVRLQYAGYINSTSPRDSHWRVN